MGYYVRSLPTKRTEPRWKVQYVSFKKKDSIHSKAKYPKKEWDISKDRWCSLGFYKYMSIKEARVRARQLNSRLEIKRQEERFLKNSKQERMLQIKFSSVLPSEFVEEFEQRFIRKRDSEVDSGRRRSSRARTIWKAAQRLIVEINKDPSDWYYTFYEVYDYFFTNQYSIGYTQSILKIANLWGYFYCKKLGRAFLPIPLPRGYERMRIIEEHARSTRNNRRASDSINPSELYKAKFKLKTNQFNWLYLSVWLGLRPKEIDSLKNEKYWRVSREGKVLVLWVYQTKIVSLPPEKRWKPIPLIYDEQRFVLKIIESKLIKRPLVKTVKRYLGKNIDLYGGRKGFTDLMLSKGHSLENISVWMGHSTIERTWKSYKQHQRFHLLDYSKY